MRTTAAVGKSTQVKAQKAAMDATKEAISKLNGAKPSLLVVFATAGYDQKELLAGVREIGGATPVVGCSGEGIITQKSSNEGSHEISVMAISSPKMKIKPLFFEGFSKGADSCGRAIADQVAKADFKGKALMVFIDGVTGNGTEFVASLQKNLPYPLLLVGGAAGSIMEKMDKTYQYYNGQAYTDAISAVLIGGDIDADVVVSHGCDPVGLELTVTKANGSYVEEIDGKPAWEVFKGYLSGNPDDLYVDDLVHLCIGETLPNKAKLPKDQEHIIRTPIRLDPSKKALFVPGQLKTGAKIVMTRRNPEKITQNAIQYARELKGRHPDKKPALIFQFDCAWRGRILFGDNISSQVISPVQEVFGKEMPWLGFHTFGEIAPVGDANYFHNVTVALCAIYDS